LGYILDKADCLIIAAEALQGDPSNELLEKAIFVVLRAKPLEFIQINQRRRMITRLETEFCSRRIHVSD
tara:strand:- start:35 stop:241 length:207 start_codon:yes stop_codon:yes gene_type:complete